MDVSNSYFTVVKPNSLYLTFNLKTTRNQESIWVSQIILKNSNNKEIAYKVMTNNSGLLKCHPPAGVIRYNQCVNIQAMAQQQLPDRTTQIKIVALSLEHSRDIEDEYDVYERFKEAKTKGLPLHSVIFVVNEFSSINNSQITYTSLGESKRIQGDESPFCGLHQFQSSHLIKLDKTTQNQLNEQFVNQLQVQQEQLMNENREISKRIVLLKAQNGISVDDNINNEQQIVFNKFQLVVIGFISFILGLYFSR